MALRGSFDMKDFGEAKKILGVELIRDRMNDIMILSQ